MKLKNKRTGEIREFTYNEAYNEFRVYKSDGIFYKTYNSLAELCEEWEDYEESKRHWIIDTMNDIVEDFNVPMDFNEAIGNYFETKEEAELAVRKLKAWKRLKDNGFKFTAWKNGILLDEAIAGQVRYEFPIDNNDEIEKDLDLLFGGEE